MGVSRFIKVALICAIFALDIEAKLIGSIGFVSPNYPDFGRYRPPQDVDEFFSDFIEAAYDSYGDAGVAVVNRLNMKRGEVLFKDIRYKNVLMIPSEENREYIENFYRNKSLEFLHNIAKDNRVDIILYSSFNKTKLKRLLRKRSHISTLVYRVFAFDDQSGARRSKYIKIKVEDLFSSPDYDPDRLQAQLIKNYIEIFQELLGHMKIIGSSYTQESVNAQGNDTDKKEASKQEQDSSASSNDSSGDW
ncbi:hypothetical protein MNB_SM-7-1378 [hydrothermal vent metagenome]|uniref:Uncharacterized protein n=1 Tax=hydrothermal vent metagenome TaxID=652676 RepID=A0A1W1BYY6_9ZZZZ